MPARSIIEKERYSGFVTWNDGQIEWVNPNGENVVINVEDVCIIGEYTTDRGPFVDDWFLTFVYRSGEWDSISIYAERIDELKWHLSSTLATDFSKYFLADSTEWRSYVRYPQELEGKQLFDLSAPKNYKAPDTLFRRLKSVLGVGRYGKSWSFELTNEMRSFVGRESKKK